MKAKENGHHARFRSVPIAFTIAALTFVPNPSAAEPTKPKTIAAQYAGGDKAALRWDHEASRSDESVCGYYPIEETMPAAPNTRSSHVRRWVGIF